MEIVYSGSITVMTKQKDGQDVCQLTCLHASANKASGQEQLYKGHDHQLFDTTDSLLS